MISDIILAVFCVAILLNAFALFRHWRALRAFEICLNNLAETQKQFNEVMETEQQRKTP